MNLLVRQSRSRYFRALHVLPSALLFLFLSALSARADDLRVVVVGGGPNPNHNQVAIESNVRYLLRLLPEGVARTILFADGDVKRESVVFEEPRKGLTAAERVLLLLLQGRDAASPTVQKFRAPSLTQLDGPAKKPDVAQALDQVRQESLAAPKPLLLYFTGHGSPDRSRTFENNLFDLWGEGGLSVRELASQISALPPSQPVTLVMVQCFSGAFGNLLFENGDPQGSPVDRDIAGFFATVKERMAAGCTPEVDEKEYHDFTSYFFAALTGRDRLGRVVKGADYNHDGHVGMDEAFCYTLIHDASIDIPVCTSDVFLRRFVTTPDEEIFKAQYRQVREWATPAQRAALEELSHSIGLIGDDRLQQAFTRFRGRGPAQDGGNGMAAARRAYSRARDETRSALIARFPGLRDSSASGYAEARKEALVWVRRQLDEGRYRDLLDADRDLDAAERAEYQQELAEARLVRFVRVAKSVILAHALRASDDDNLKRRFDSLALAESRTLLPMADRQRSAETPPGAAVRAAQIPARTLHNK